MLRRAAVVAALTFGLLAGGCGQSRPAKPPALVGAWRSTVQFKSGAFASVKDLQFMYVLNAGGTLTESSNYDAAPPVPPAYGVWRPIGPREFEAKYEYFATALPSGLDALKNGGGWLPSGRGVLIERITLSEDARIFTSSIRYEARDSLGNAVVGGGEATGRGERIGF